VKIYNQIKRIQTTQTQMSTNNTISFDEIQINLTTNANSFENSKSCSSSSSSSQKSKSSRSNSCPASKKSMFKISQLDGVSSICSNFSGKDMINKSYEKEFAQLFENDSCEDKNQDTSFLTFAGSKRKANKSTENLE
jgi:Cft2 family RNA processing exonuclease